MSGFVDNGTDDKECVAVADAGGAPSGLGVDLGRLLTHHELCYAQGRHRTVTKP